MKTFHIILTLLFLISCSDNEPDPDRIKLSDLENYPIFTPGGPGVITNPYGRPALSALIDDIELKDLHPHSFYNGLWYSISTRNINSESLTLNFPKIELGTFILSDDSGFARAFLNGVPCSVGEISILKIEDNLVSGHFQFTSGNNEVRSGEFHELSFEDFEVPGNNRITATINGEHWEAEVYDNVLGASFFNVQGYNSIGNFLLGFGSTYFIEPGLYDLTDQESTQPGLWIQVGKDQPQLIRGIVILESTSNGFNGQFSADFDGFRITNGRFQLLSN